MTLQDQSTSRRNYLRWSFGWLFTALIFAVLTGIILDAALAPLALSFQRWVVVVTLVLPATLGAVTGLLALRQKGSRKLPALLSVILNGLFALFYLALLAIAG